MTTIVDDATALLHWLAEVRARENDDQQGHHFLSGREIMRHEPWVNVTPSRLNDVAALLDETGYATLQRGNGTTPFKFSGIGLTTKGRVEHERLRALEAAHEAEQIDESQWDHYPPNKMAEPPVDCLLRRAQYDADVSRLFDGLKDGEVAALVQLDIDHFKKHNTELGHDGADLVLRGVAIILRAIVGRRGRTYRYGGEELVALLPDYALPEAIATAERIRASIEARSWDAEGFPDLKLTVSIGVAEGTTGQAASAVYRAADQATQSAKDSGRNRVMS